MRLDIGSLTARVAQGSSVMTRCRKLALLALAAASINATQAMAQAPHLRAYRPATEIDWDLVNRVFAMICEAGIREPKIVMAQAILETGWFRSAGLMSKNNVFGFRNAQYLQFDRLEDSVSYYKAWQDERWQPSDASYFHFLERVRYAVPGYTRHVKSISWNEECPAAPPPAPPPATRATSGQSDSFFQSRDPGRL